MASLLLHIYGILQNCDSMFSFPVSWFWLPVLIVRVVTELYLLGRKKRTACNSIPA